MHVAPRVPTMQSGMLCEVSQLRHASLQDRVSPACMCAYTCASVPEHMLRLCNVASLRQGAGACLHLCLMSLQLVVRGCGHAAILQLGHLSLKHRQLLLQSVILLPLAIPANSLPYQRRLTSLWASAARSAHRRTLNPDH